MSLALGIYMATDENKRTKEIRKVVILLLRVLIEGKTYIHTAGHM